MIMAKAPFRVGFVGGGSDLKSFYKKDYGAVVSSTINKYMYIMIHPYFHDKIRIKYSKLEDVNSAEEVKHPIVRACLKLVRIEKGVEITSIADVPAGTGLGSSSAFTVCLLHALYAYKGKYVTKEMLAEKASKIEIDVLKEPIGKQDQYAASYGGLNYIRFNRDETVWVEPLVMNPERKKALERNLLMFYFGSTRNASQILAEQKENMRYLSKFENVKRMVKLAEDLKVLLCDGKVKEVGRILHNGWLLKKSLASNITNSFLDEHYDRALKAGAVGGKLLGAGGGGFLLFYCEPKYQNTVREVLGLRELKFNFDTEGSKIVHISS